VAVPNQVTGMLSLHNANLVLSSLTELSLSHLLHQVK
jgi:hypothetical protein